MILQEQIAISTSGRGTYEITDRICNFVKSSSLKQGICHVFVHHTSASLILCENADPSVRTDLETFMVKLVPDGSPMFMHISEGADDMPAHVRSILTQVSLSIPISHGRCALGTWQGIYLWEHRLSHHNRKITITLHG